MTLRRWAIFESDSHETRTGKFSGGSRCAVGIDKIIFIAIVYLIDNKRSVDRIISDLDKTLK